MRLSINNLITLPLFSERQALLIVANNFYHCITPNFTSLESELSVTQAVIKLTGTTRPAR